MYLRVRRLSLAGTTIFTTCMGFSQIQPVEPVTFTHNFHVGRASLLHFYFELLFFHEVDWEGILVGRNSGTFCFHPMLMALKKKFCSQKEKVL